ncbi:MAG: alpha/beta hydrolase-fold protein [Candidatus Pedobacter colombiensis]|uniref:Alpha/beta hydrolase-fold protein n=1 Tax=Candidatus Pedobacter colombiensis TaxID=3121371 RepID=A0AAJ5WAZ9_9SPHI|nr:alpha/beta hydrolase-fold protein [Pedobacter sp.]WEK20336.1 MAG: alpha/beta hydrolase-fold protein [Pedobacter sp.]
MKYILKLCLLFSLFTLRIQAQNKILVKLAEDLKGPYTGRLMVYTQADTSKPFGQVQEDTPAFAITVKNWKAGETQTLDHASFSYLKPLDSLKRGFYKLVAILDTNTKERGNNAPGNLYTRTEVVAMFDYGVTALPTLTLSNVFPERIFKQSDLVKEVVLKSDLLTKFRGEPIFMKAGVVLPPSYQSNSDKKYPVVYVIPGWGGTHHNVYNKGQQNAYGIGKGEEKIYVFLNPETQTPYGLHAFVDSRVNGPWGTALVTELIPYLENQFSISKLTKHRLITGQSSGGYGAIWLALHFPDKFGGCWATSPDPVDFSSFTGIDIYKDDNYFYTPQKNERGIFIINGKATSTLKKMSLKEQLEGDGGQTQSFEAEFGVPGKDKRPQPLFNPLTGKINKAVANSWKPYDLALYVQQNWHEIKKDAGNKIRIYAGENDNFLLQNSVMAFRDKIKLVNAHIHIEIVKGANHFNTRLIVADTIQKEMDAAITRHCSN